MQLVCVTEVTEVCVTEVTVVCVTEVTVVCVTEVTVVCVTEVTVVCVTEVCFYLNSNDPAACRQVRSQNTSPLNHKIPEN